MEIPSFYLEQMYNNYSLLFEATRILYKTETGIKADQNKTGKLQSTTTLSRYGLIPCFRQEQLSYLWIAGFHWRPENKFTFLLCDRRLKNPTSGCLSFQVKKKRHNCENWSSVISAS